MSVGDLGEQGGARRKDLDGVWDLAGSDAQTLHTDPRDGLTGDMCQTSRPHTSLHLPVDKLLKLKTTERSHVVQFNLWKF